MKRIKLFEEFLNEVYTKEPNKDAMMHLKDQDLHVLFAFMNDMIVASPIGFACTGVSAGWSDDDSKTGYIGFSNPFKMFMQLAIDTKRLGHNQVEKIGVKCIIYKHSTNEPERFEEVAPDALSLIKKIKKAPEFKSFVKGLSPEKAVEHDKHEECNGCLGNFPR